MCRLVLFNAEAFLLIQKHLPDFFRFLEHVQGGDGNGVAALWPDGSTSIRKGLTLSARQASIWLHRSHHDGAIWFLFHTRRATTATIERNLCHPFRAGHLILAHNGHDHEFALLGQTHALSDSACITRTWSRLNFPIETLSTVTGVFVGFQQGSPFVIKGNSLSDLLLFHTDTAFLFTSSTSPTLESVFEKRIDINTLCWTGQPLNPHTIQPRYQHAKKHTLRQKGSSHHVSSALDELASHRLFER